jgi:hypothetical protein
MMPLQRPLPSPAQVYITCIFNTFGLSIEILDTFMQH